MLLTYNLNLTTRVGQKKDTVHLLKEIFLVAKIILVAIIAKKETNFEYSLTAIFAQCKSNLIFL